MMLISLRCPWGGAAGSSTHLAVLTSDNAWRLYSVADLSLPEQSFDLRLEPRRRVKASCSMPVHGHMHKIEHRCTCQPPQGSRRSSLPHPKPTLTVCKQRRHVGPALLLLYGFRILLGTLWC